MFLDLTLQPYYTGFIRALSFSTSVPALDLSTRSTGVQRKQMRTRAVS